MQNTNQFAQRGSQNLQFFSFDAQVPLLSPNLISLPVYISATAEHCAARTVETFEEMMRAGKRREKEGFTTLWQGLISIQEKAAEERMQQKKSQQESCD